MSYKIGIYIYHDVEVLDFAGPFEVFTTASRVLAKRQPQMEIMFEPILIAERLDDVRARGDFFVRPHFGIESHPELDVLLIPGGVVDDEIEKSAVIAWIERISKTARISAAVCTGAFLLAKAGVLAGKQATTHWEDFPAFREMFPDIPLKEGIRWVEQGRVITSAGISAGIDMSLYLVQRLGDEALALATARQMEYLWNRSLVDSYG